MDQGPIDVVVISPERRVFQEQVDALVLTAHDGELGILRDRAPLMCELAVGQLRYTKDGQTQRFFVDGGFAQVLANSVTVLTSQALPAEMVTAEVVEAAEREVEQHQGTRLEERQAREHAQRRLSVLRALHGRR
jgi:F-type H+-transporting ATPase subunit epsilon